jgi:hypothetical protein
MTDHNPSTRTTQFFLTTWPVLTSTAYKLTVDYETWMTLIKSSWILSCGVLRHSRWTPTTPHYQWLYILLLRIRKAPESNSPELHVSRLSSVSWCLTSTETATSERSIQTNPLNPSGKSMYQLVAVNCVLCIHGYCRSQWSCGVSLRPLGCWGRGFESCSGHGYLSLCLYVVQSCVSRGICDGLITRPEESYRVSVCVWSRNPEKGGQRSIVDYKSLWMNSWILYDSGNNRCLHWESFETYKCTVLAKFGVTGC